MFNTRALLALTAAAFLLAGCGFTGESPPDTPDPVVTETRTMTVSPTETPDATPSASTVPQATAQTDACDKGWSTLEDSTEPHLVRGDTALYDVRTAAHDSECFDRIVFDVATTEPVGFHVRYVDVVHQDGSGFAVPVAGGAALQVVIDAWAKSDAFAGYGFQPQGWRALREIKFASSFEGQTTFAMGVARQTPFAVYHLPADDHMRVVVDIAHQ